ncbi:MAG: endolytic transglycosylase MltG [Aquificae bacterium]|nr:endolytic transglycosylase MltG [Aquificota bacterium]
MKKLIIFLIITFSLLFYGLKKLTVVNLSNPVVIEVEKGDSLKTISKKLQKTGIIKDWRIFYIYSLLKGETLRYGFYEFSGNPSIFKVWQTLYTGKEKLISVTITAGNDLIDIAQKLQNAGLIKKETFLKYVFNQKNVQKFGLKGESFEGYFPPETYFFRKGETVENIVKTFLQEFKRKYSSYISIAEKKGIDFYKLMKIASLVEKETFIDEEKPIIAGVINNRLKKRMHLQIDPTVIYALKLEKKWSGHLNRQDMKIKSPYNTYLNYGLPPTPIGNFSITSLEASIFFRKTAFLYYVFDGKKHLFSKTYREHIKNINKIKKDKK